MAAPTAQTAAPARRRILDAALELFVQRGVLGTSIEEVCARSRASVGSVYHHFGDKQGIAAALYMEGLAAYQRAFVEQLRDHEDAEAGVRGTVEFHLRWCAEHRDLMRFLLANGEVAYRTPELAEHNREFFGDVLAWWRPHARYGALRELDLDLAYALWLGPAQEFCRLWLAGRAASAPRRAGRTLADGAWHALRTRGGT
jgi:AcrR family transcriptional regulator